MADALVSLVLDKLTALISEEVGTFYKAKKDLENLKSELEAIKSTLKYADGLPYFEVEGLKDWLQKLKDVSYDAEDIIDKYQANISKRKREVNINKQVRSPVANYFSSLCHNHRRLRYKLGKDINAINERLAQISKEKDRYKNILQVFASRALRTTNDRATSCFIDKKDIIGRENDQTTLIQTLVGEDTTMGGGGCNVSIFSIVGIGGVGKTTLAQMVFDNDQVKEHFKDFMWWVSILQQPNAKDVTKRIVEQIKKDEVKVSELNMLIQLVHSTTSKNKFLLVLDDVWNLDWWQPLEPVLIKKGAPGSRIIMTSRKEHISKGIGAAYMLELKSLTHEKGWELFLREALIKEDELKRLNLEEIGRNIVSKCGGLPLVIQTVGKVMKSKERTREDWEFIANSKIWDLKIPSITSDSSLLPGLILSYDDLSPILKHYFTYCSLNPKGLPFRKQDLIMNLMAHGLVENANERNMEVVANQYIDDMLGRCLFQAFQLYPFGLCLQMHDTVHDLATHVAGKEYAHNSADENTRHLIISKHLSSLHEIGLQRNQVLRTFLCRKPLSENPLDKYINNLKMLRVLDLTGGRFTELPDSIGDLLLLKHLDLMHTKIKQLPASIGKLQSLLSLLLGSSEIQELPKEIGQLCNLRHLGLENTHQLEFVAEGLGKLSCLRTLSRFIICQANKANVGCNVKELKNLINLKGELTIENLERIILINDASEALLQEKKDIESLDLSFGEIVIGEETSKEDEKKIAEDQENLLQQLQLPPNLRSLSLTRYCGKNLPIHWFDGCVRIETIKFQSCLWIEKLPSFSELKRLHLYYFCHLKTLAESPCLEELVIDGCASFTQLPFRPKLESVELSNLDNWEGFEKGAEKYCIKTLKISKCLKVKGLPHLPSLQRLEINFCNELSSLVEKEEEAEFELNMPALTELVIRGCPALVELPDMPILKSLTIEGCDELKQLAFMGKLEKLEVSDCKNWEGWSLEGKKNATLPVMQKVKISRCPKLRTLPSFGALTYMEIHGCEELRALWREDDQLIGLEVLKVLRCPNVSFQVDWLLPLTKIRYIMTDGPLYCLHLTSAHIEALQRLKELGLLGMSGQSLLPEWLWRLSGLQGLALDGASSSGWYGPWEKLKELEFLGIGGCRDVVLDGLFKHSPNSSDEPTEEQCCPSEGTHFSVPPKLEQLEFRGCSNLKLLPDGLQHLVHLKVLRLADLPELASLPQCLTSLPKLEELEITDCPKLASLPAGLKARLGNGLKVSGNCPLLLRRAT